MRTLLGIVGLCVSCALAIYFWSTNPDAASVGKTFRTPQQTVVATPYLTEQAWASREIMSDISEMANSRSQPAAAMSDQPITPWQVQLFADYAGRRFAGHARTPSAVVDPPDQYRSLIDMSAENIVKANVEVSAALKRDMNNPRAHEAAALVLGAFAMREAAGGMSDVRWAMNRMTAHLAVAAALRTDPVSAMSEDGRLANAVLMILSNHRRAADEAIAALPVVPRFEFAAWQRALKIRNTEDWRALPDPAKATRLEKLEYFRARRITLRYLRAGQELEDLREVPAPDFSRLVLAYNMGVEDGDEFGGEAFVTTLDELAVVYRAMHQRSLPDDLPAELINVRAGRLLSNGDPQVLPWGAWAEFGQRHIGEAIGDIDAHYRKMLALPERADELKKFIDQRFHHLTLFPVAASARTVGKGDVADMRFLDQTVDVAIKSPELMTFDFWSWLEKTISHERRPRLMPDHTVWFSTPSASMPYEASLRIGGAPLPVTGAAFDALIDEAPQDYTLNARAPQLFLDDSLKAKAVHNIRRASITTFARSIRRLRSPLTKLSGGRCSANGVSSPSVNVRGMQES